MNNILVINDHARITFSKKQQMQEPLHFTARHRLLPTDSAMRSANNGETVRIYIKNGRCKAAPTNSVISGMFTASAVGAQ